MKPAAFQTPTPLPKKEVFTPLRPFDIPQVLQKFIGSFNTVSIAPDVQCMYFH